MNKYLVLTSDGKLAKVVADDATVRDGVLCFHTSTRPSVSRIVVAYAIGSWQFFGLLGPDGAPLYIDQE